MPATGYLSLVSPWFKMMRMIVLIFANYTFLQSNGKYFYLIHDAYSDNEEIVEIL